MDMTPEDEKEPSQPVSDPSEQQPPEAPETSEAPETQALPEAEGKRLTSEEALAEMRRTLREEEQTAKPTGFVAALKRIGAKLLRRKSRRPSGEAAEAAARLDEMQIPEVGPAAAEEAKEAPAEPPTPGEAESTFGSMVRDRLTGPLSQRESLEPVVHEEAPEEIREQEPAGAAEPQHGILTSIRESDKDSEEELSALRQEALEDYEAAPAEAEQEGYTSLSGRLRRSWRYMPLMERRLLIGALVIVALAVLAGTGVAVMQSIPTPTPAPTPTASIVPVPISISLPGGWVFPLRTGFVVDGKWDPQGAEWLSGTEICRWVSLPYSVQLEAVLRTLKANDEIKLSMSNYEGLTYKVQSIEHVQASEINKLASDTPSLLVILTNKDTSDRYVVVAKP